MLDHPNIVSFKDCFDDDENVYMSLELCERGVRICIGVLSPFKCAVLMFHSRVHTEYDGPPPLSKRINGTGSEDVPCPTSRRVLVHA